MFLGVNSLLYMGAGEEAEGKINEQIQDVLVFISAVTNDHKLRGLK